MNLKDAVKSITYLKNNAAEVVHDAATTGRNLIVTQNGEARAVVMGMTQYQEWRRTMALLKLVALGEADVASGRVVGQGDAVSRARMAARRASDNE